VSSHIPQEEERRGEERRGEEREEKKKGRKGEMESVEGKEEGMDKERRGEAHLGCICLPKSSGYLTSSGSLTIMSVAF